MASVPSKRSNRKIRRTDNLISLDESHHNDDVAAIEDFSLKTTPEKTSRNKKRETQTRTKRLLRSTATESSEELKKNDEEAVIVKKKKKKSSKKRSSIKEDSNNETDIDTESVVKAKKSKRKKSKKDNYVQAPSDECVESNLSAADEATEKKKSKKKKKKSDSGSELKRKLKNEDADESEGESKSNISKNSSKKKAKKISKLEKNGESHSSEELPELEKASDKNNCLSEKKEEKSKRSRLVRQDAVNTQSITIYSDISGCEEIEESFNKSNGLIIDLPAEASLKKSPNKTLENAENVETNISRTFNKSNRKSSLPQSLLAFFKTALEENNDGTKTEIHSGSGIFSENNEIEANSSFLNEAAKTPREKQNVSVEKNQQAEISRTDINTKSPEPNVPQELPLTARKKWSIQSTEPDWYETLKNIAPSSSNSSINNDVIEIVNTTESFSIICDLSDIKDQTTTGIVPSKCGEVDVERRRTYELEKSVNEVSLLKNLSESKQQITMSHEENPFSKITLRRRNNNENMLLDNITSPCISTSLSVESPPPMNSTKSHQNKAKRASLGRISRSLSNTPLKDFASPKNRTSTPLQRRKSHNLLKDVLTKDKLFENISNISNISNVSASMKFSSKIKPMPNFSAIHQKALDKVEDIGQYQQRKAERAQFLLSGQKPMNKTFSPHPKESKKQLRFDGTADSKEKPRNFIPLPSTPKPRFVNRMHMDSPMRVQSGSSFKLPEAKCATPRFNIGVNPTQKTCANGSGKKKYGNFKNRLPVRIVKENKENKPSVKVITQKVNNLNNLKEIVTKETSKTSDRRNVIKGVRSNRRFDLLMKMRQNK